MSVSQKIFNLIHSSPKTSHFKMRDLNVYFKDSINPTYKLISLDNIDSLELQIEEENKEYLLFAYITKNSKERNVLLGSFESKKEAQNALHTVKNKLYGNAKSLLTLANAIFLTIIFAAFVSGTVSSLKPSSISVPTFSPNNQGVPTGIANLNLPNSNNGTLSLTDMSNLQKQLLQQALQQASQQGLTGNTNTATLPQLPNLPNLSNTNATMDSIVSDAIQQSQTQSPVEGISLPQATSIPQIVEQPASAGDDLLQQIK